MLKILYICKDFTNWIGHGHLAFKKALARVADVTFHHKSCHVPTLLKELADKGKTFDLLMLGEAPPVTPPLTGLAEVKLPKVVHYWDVHAYQRDRLLFIKENKIDFVVVKFKEGTLKLFPRLLDVVPCEWLPIGVDTHVFKKWSQTKTIDILLTGAILPDVYPMRASYLRTFKGYPGFVHVPHPGYGHFDSRTAIVHDTYAKLLNSAKVCPTCGSIYNYSIQKFFEIPASFSLLAAPPISDIVELGYVPDKHFLSVSPTSFEDKILSVLRDEDRLVEITTRGYRLVRKFHSVDVRAKQFVNLMCRAVLGVKQPFDGLREFSLK